MKKNILFCLVALTMMACTGATTEPLKPHYVVSDKEGTKFLLNDYNSATETAEVLKNYKYVIYDGIYYPVVFKGFQEGDSENSNGRDLYYNFDNLTGYLFEMKQGKLLTEPEDEYDAIYDYPLLVDQTFKDAIKILPVEVTGDEASETVVAKLEKMFNRELMWATVEYVFGENHEYQFFNAQFQNEGNQALAVIGVVMPDGSLRVKDFPAEWNEYSVWRVDDEGDFFGFRIDLVCIDNGELILYTCDPGAEGTNFQSYIVKDDGLVEGNLSTSFYTADI